MFYTDYKNNPFTRKLFEKIQKKYVKLMKTNNYNWLFI